MPAPTLATVNAGDAVNASLINNLTANFQAVAGATEVAFYAISGNGYTTNAIISSYVRSFSFGSTPVSVSLAGTTTGLNTPNTSHLSVSGFQAFAGATVATNNAFVNGNSTIQY